MLIDTHCHIHESDFPISADQVLKNAQKAGIEAIICSGTNQKTSLEALKFAQMPSNVVVFTTVGNHPYFALETTDWIQSLIDNKKVVAIGEIGLDYTHGVIDHAQQIKCLEQQIEIALQAGLPIVFHVREAFDDFWPVFDNFHGIRGTLHCFTDNQQNAEKALTRGLFISLNGISTFTKEKTQQQMYQNLPLDRIVLETDAPFLTPVPLRGKIEVNEPAYIREIARWNSDTRGISFDEFASITTDNARTLFNLNY